jgi:formate dehydrogenase subunit delta
MRSTDETLAYMADQIARNFAALGHDAAVTATADHIATFWDPAMRRRAFALLDSGDPALTPFAVAALRLLQQRGAPDHQTRGTTFAGANDPSDRSDAG